MIADDIAKEQEGFLPVKNCILGNHFGLLGLPYPNFACFSCKSADFSAFLSLWRTIFLKKIGRISSDLRKKKRNFFLF